MHQASLFNQSVWPVYLTSLSGHSVWPVYLTSLSGQSAYMYCLHTCIFAFAKNNKSVHGMSKYDTSSISLNWYCYSK